MSSCQLTVCHCSRKRRCDLLCVYVHFCFRVLTIEGSGILYLYVKTIERAHTPANMWERIKLSNNYAKALEQVRLCSFSRSALIFPCKYVDWRWTDSLAQLHNSQMQATCNEDHTVPHQNATTQTSPTVCAIIVQSSTPERLVFLSKYHSL